VCVRVRGCIGSLYSLPSVPRLPCPPSPSPPPPTPTLFPTPFCFFFRSKHKGCSVCFVLSPASHGTVGARDHGRSRVGGGGRSGGGRGGAPRRPPSGTSADAAGGDGDGGRIGVGSGGAVRSAALLQLVGDDRGPGVCDGRNATGLPHGRAASGRRDGVLRCQAVPAVDGTPGAAELRGRAARVRDGPGVRGGVQPEETPQDSGVHSGVRGGVLGSGTVIHARARMCV
jgi:hypothetical protein